MLFMCQGGAVMPTNLVQLVDTKILSMKCACSLLPDLVRLFTTHFGMFTLETENVKMTGKINAFRLGTL